MGSQVKLTIEAHLQLKLLPDFIQPLARDALSALIFEASDPGNERVVGARLIQKFRGYGVTHYTVNVHFIYDSTANAATVTQITYVESSGPH
jgi:hypothetical protein